MRERIRLQQEYGDLVRARKWDEAQELMNKIRGRVKPKSVNIVEPIVKEVITTIDEHPVVRKQTEITLDDLCKIKGIGKKTVKDIKVMFKDVETLKIALKGKKVALRDDVVKKLEEELI